MSKEMKSMDCPDLKVWNERGDWMDGELENAETGGVYDVSDHSTALFIDLRLAFCAGAWLSVIVMSVSVLDAHLRETESGDNKIGTARLFDNFYHGENTEITWLRQLRNKYVHIDLDNPALTIDKWYFNEKEMEAEARKAILICIKAFFQSPGV